MPDELRDVEAIRADWALYMAHATPDAVPPREWHNAEKRLASDAGPLLAVLADRDAKLAAAQKFRDGVQALFDGEVAARTECAGRAARGEDCGCSTKDCYEHGNWHNCTCSPLNAMVPLVMEYDSALSLSVPTSPQTKSNARLFLNGKPVDEVLRPGRPITEPPRPANQIVITRDDLLPSPQTDERGEWHEYDCGPLFGAYPHWHPVSLEQQDEQRCEHGETQPHGIHDGPTSRAGICLGCDFRRCPGPSGVSPSSSNSREANV